MIDWIKAIIPCHYTDEICSERITRFDPKTGETKWEIDARVGVEGTYSAKVHVKAYGPNLILIDGNPSKFMQGHNIFGTNDLLGLCSAFFLNVCKALNIQPTIEDIQLWKNGHFEIKTIDITESFRLKSQEDVASWLRAATPIARARHQAASAYSGETLYIGQKSRRISTKIYNKWKELQVHKFSRDMPHIDKLHNYAKPLLRLEIRLHSMELQRRGLNTGKDWTDEKIQSQILEERIGSLKMNQKMRLTRNELVELPPRLIAIYKLWQQGEDLRMMYPRRTFYRYRTELEKHGIDITAPHPKKAEVVPLIRYLTAEYVPEIPDWAKETNLYFDPDQQSNYG